MKIPRLLKYAVSTRQGPIAVLWILGLLHIGFSTVMPSQVGKLTDLFGQGSGAAWSPVHRAILLLIGAQLALSFISYFRKLIEIRLTESMERSLTLDVFSRLLRFSPDFFREREVEKINSRALEDSGLVAEFWVGVVISLPMGIVSILVFGALMIANNVFLGAVMIPLSMLSGYFVLFDRRIQEANHRAREGWDAIRVESNQVVANVSEIRSHGAFEFALQGLNRSFGAYKEVITEIARLNALFRAVNPILGSLQMGMLYWLGAGLCMAGSSLAAFAGKMTWGEVITFTLLARLFEQPVSEVAEAVLKWRMTRENLRRLDEYLDRPMAFGSTPGAPLLDANNLDLAFDHVGVVTPSGAKILEEVGLRIPKGRHVAFSGPAGCGKSSLLNLVSRNLDRSSGTVTLGGRPVEEVDVLALARELGVVPQVPAVFNTSLRNNILFALRRPSDRFLSDAEGRIDISRFPDVSSIEDLERKVLKVVDAVGLTRDVLKKCLDAKPASATLPPEFRRRLADARRAVGEKVGGTGLPAIVPFQRRQLLPGTVRENILGPAASAEGPGADAEAKILFDLLQGAPILEELTGLGRTRLLSEQALAARVLQRSPALGAFLSSHARLSESDARKLFDSLSRADRAFDHDLRLAFLKVGLDLDAGQAGLGERILESRERYFGRSGASWPACWRDPGSRDEFLDGLNVRENLVWGRVDPSVHGAAEQMDRLIEEGLEASGLLSQALLVGLEFTVGEEGKFLSGGQRQKLALARTILKDPSILLLDEATASLDQASQARVLDLVRREFRGKTVLSISHRLSTIRDSDQIVVLDRGRVVQEGSYDELAGRPGVFRGLLQREEGKEAETGKDVAPSSDLRRRLALCPAFSHLKSDDLAFLEGISRIVQSPEGRVLFRRGDPGTELYLILEGEIEFFIDRNGRSEVLNVYGPGKAFGELALFGGGSRTAGARAKTPASLAVIERENLLKLIAADPRIAIGLLEGLSRRMAEITDQQAEAPAA